MKSLFNNLHILAGVIIFLSFQVRVFGQCETGCDNVISTPQSYFGNTIIVNPGEVTCIVSGGRISSIGNLIINGTLRICPGAEAIQAGNIVFGAGGVLQIYDGSDVDIAGNAIPSTSIQVPSCPLPAGISFADFTCNVVTINTALPVELREFSGNITFKKTSALKWSTSSEHNNDYFSIEYSDDGEVFDEIAQVLGHGDSDQVITYTYEDPYPRFGTFYYRLKQVDYDGAYSYSNVISLQQSIVEDILIYPNPVVSDLNIRLLGKYEKAEVALLDSKGNYISQLSRKSTQGAISLPTKHFSKGIYFVKVTTEGSTDYYRVVKK